MDEQDKMEIIAALLWAMHASKDADEMTPEIAHALAAVALRGVQDAYATLGDESDLTAKPS
jgi:hypothetical protein